MLDFAGVKGVEKRRYIAAVQAGLDRDYEPILAEVAFYNRGLLGWHGISRAVRW
jgi:hypothetical protein